MVGWYHGGYGKIWSVLVGCTISGGGRDNGEGKLRVHPANLGSPER